MNKTPIEKSQILIYEEGSIVLSHVIYEKR